MVLDLRYFDGVCEGEASDAHAQVRCFNLVPQLDWEDGDLIPRLGGQENLPPSVHTASFERYMRLSVDADVQ